MAVSGATLACCWFVLCTFPQEMVSSVGLGAGVTCVVCVLVNLTLTPCALVVFPEFFGNFDDDPVHGLSQSLWACLFRLVGDCREQGRPLH